MHRNTTPFARVVALGKREIGPIGTAARLIVAAAAISLPVLFDEFSSWDLLVALVALPALAIIGFELVRRSYERYIPGGLASQTGTCCGATTWLSAIMLAGAIPLAALTPVTFTAFWIWLGASMLLAAVRGYGGCEIVAFPNVLTGRRDQLGCILFTPIDRAEAIRQFPAGTRSRSRST